VATGAEQEAAPNTQAMQAVLAELATNPVLHPVTTVAEEHPDAFAGHNTQTDDSN